EATWPEYPPGDAECTDTAPRPYAGGMLRWERGSVKSALGSWPGGDRVEVELEEGTGTVPAIAYRELTGQPLPGELVLLNTNALRRDLGTGGDAMVVARPEMLPAAEEVAGH